MKYIKDPSAQRSTHNKGKQKITQRQMTRIKQTAMKYPLSTNNQVFERAGATNISKTTRCRPLKNIANCDQTKHSITI